MSDVLKTAQGHARVEQNRCRVAELAEILRRDGPSSATLLKHCEQKWGIRQRQAYDLIARARKAITEDFDQVERLEMLALNTHRLERLYEEAMTNKCYPAAASAISQLNSMLGIGFTTK